MASGSIVLGALSFSMSLVAALVSLGIAPVEAARKRHEAELGAGVIDQKYSGMWETADGQIRHELRPNGRYVETLGETEAYKGRYMILGDHIEYRDDSGFTGSGDFRDGMLYHSGMVLYRRDSV